MSGQWSVELELQHLAVSAPRKRRSRRRKREPKPWPPAELALPSLAELERLSRPRAEKIQLELPFMRNSSFIILLSALCILHSAFCLGSISECIDATCRISAGGSRGTGCAFERSQGYVYVLTAAHVVGNSRSVQCEFWRDGHQSKPVGGIVIKRSPGADAAVVAIAESAFEGILPKIIPVAEADYVLRPGDTVTSVGCANGTWSTGWKGHFLGYRNGATAASGDLHFLPPPADGRSGSAIFDAAGQRIVGLLRARTQNEGIATPLATLYRALGSAPDRRLESPPTVSPVCPDRRACPRLPLFGGLRPPQAQPPPAQREPKPSQPLPLPGREELAPIEKRIGGIERAIGILPKLRERIEALKPADEQGFRTMAREVVLGVIAERAPAAASLEAWLPGLLAALGWTCPPAIAAVLLGRIGVGFVRRRVKARKTVNGQASQASQASQAPIFREQRSTGPIVVQQQSPPPPQVSVRDREFVSYESPNGQLKALQWALDQYVRQFPGARATVETIESYARQYESGQQSSNSKKE